VLTLSANYNLPNGSTVTISGLTGAQTEDTPLLPVTSTYGLFGSTGVWTKIPGQLVLTASSGGLTLGKACVVTFTLTNKATEQPSPTVFVSGTMSQAPVQIAFTAVKLDTGLNMSGIIWKVYDSYPAQFGGCIDAGCGNLVTEYLPPSERQAKLQVALDTFMLGKVLTFSGGSWDLSWDAQNTPILTGVADILKKDPGIVINVHGKQAGNVSPLTSDPISGANNVHSRVTVHSSTYWCGPLTTT
jgi:hypothetical protein